MIDYRLGLSCTAADACKDLKNNLRKRDISKGIALPKLRMDNGLQFVARQFQQLYDQLGVIHERVPGRTPNMNAHIESFHSILEEEYYSRYEFQNSMEAYAIVTEYMDYYNKRRKHGSLRYMTP